MGKGVRRMMAGEFKVSSFELEHNPRFWIEQNVQVLMQFSHSHCFFFYGIKVFGCHIGS